MPLKLSCGNIFDERFRSCDISAVFVLDIYDRVVYGMAKQILCNPTPLPLQNYLMSLTDTVGLLVGSALIPFLTKAIGWHKYGVHIPLQILSLLIVIHRVYLLFATVTIFPILTLSALSGKLYSQRSETYPVAGVHEDVIIDESSGSDRRVDQYHGSKIKPDINTMGSSQTISTHSDSGSISSTARTQNGSDPPAGLGSDRLGALLLPFLGLSATLSLDGALTKAWPDPRTIASIGVTCVLLCAFALVEVRVASYPVVPIQKVFTRKTGAVLVTQSMLLMAVTSVWLTGPWFQIISSWNLIFQ